MQFHFFHMLLGTWQLVHYLWTTQKRQARTYVYYWTSFIFHTGIVWFYTSGITVSVRVQLVHAPGDNAPVAVPPPMPAAPDPEAVAMAIAAARAADAAAARLASRRRSSASSPRGSPRFGSGSPQRGSSRSSSRRDSTVRAGSSRRKLFGTQEAAGRKSGERCAWLRDPNPVRLLGVDSFENGSGAIRGKAADAEEQRSRPARAIRRRPTVSDAKRLWRFRRLARSLRTDLYAVRASCEQSARRF
ncbi:hypothetical protein MTO96_017240 [Rhipicephalus appendiculatus]